MNDEKEEQRTKAQNRALHKYAQLLSDALNDGGRDVRKTINIPVSFTKETVWDYMVHPVMKALYSSKDSTTQLSTKQIGVLYENLNRMTAEKFEISVPFPDRFGGGSV